MEMFDIEGKRILEVGCGVGLTSLMLNSRVAGITATDHHPEAESYLQLNVDLNKRRAIPFVRSGWEQKIPISETMTQSLAVMFCTSRITPHSYQVSLIGLRGKSVKSLLSILEGELTRPTSKICSME
jgi:hypothetical protein